MNASEETKALGPLLIRWATLDMMFWEVMLAFWNPSLILKIGSTCGVFPTLSVTFFFCPPVTLLDKAIFRSLQRWTVGRGWAAAAHGDGEPGREGAEDRGLHPGCRPSPSPCEMVGGPQLPFL